MKLPFAVTLGPGSSRADHTGAWRTERAVYVQRTAPCGNACPADEDVRDWLYDAESGGAGYESAWRRIMETNPFPAVCGRVCHHPCETACNRGNLDEAVGINSVERFLGDEALAQGWRVSITAEPTGRRVLVVGSGPAGLSAAYHLVRRGHAVTIRESAPIAGGMMRYGIPRYRLPREVLDAEIDRLLDLGITLEVDTPVTDLDSVMADEGWDAAFLAVGAQLGHRTYLPAASASRVLDAVSLLHGLEEGERPLLGRRVAVYGGGNTAVDAARTARRLGASDAVVVYRRTRERMPAHAEEVTEAEEEGVVFHWLSTIERVEPDGLVIEQMELDEDGFPQPTGRTERLEADSVVLALGQDTDLSFLSDASALQVSAAVGAFMLGIAISGATAHNATRILEPLRDLFAAIFFVAFGLNTDPTSIPPVLGWALLLAVLTAATKMLTGIWAAKRAGIAMPGRFRAGAALIARGEFSIVIAGLAVASGAVPGELAALATAYVLIMAIVGPLAARFVEPVVKAIRRTPKAPPRTTDRAPA